MVFIDDGKKVFESVENGAMPGYLEDFGSSSSVSIGKVNKYRSGTQGGTHCGSNTQND